MNVNHDYVEKYSYQGNTYTLAQLSSMTSIEDFNLRYHLRLNRTVQDTLNRIGKSNSNVFHENKWHTYAELSLLLDIEEEDVAQGAKDLLTVPEIIAIYKDRPKTLTFEYEGKQRTATEIANVAKTKANLKYPLSSNKEYGIWLNMLASCTNKKSVCWINNGAKGITVCDKWKKSFIDFYSDLGPRPSKSHRLHRNDKLKNFEPFNCSWVTLKEQSKSRLSTTHGMARTTEYRIWCAMLNRCYNKKLKHYSNYGGRGIKVCDQWKNSFVNFYKDMGPRPKQRTLDRKDNDADYNLENCRWATLKEQNNNKRTTRYVVLEDGTRLTFSEAADALGLSINTVRSRVRNGVEIEKPVDKRYPDVKYLHENIYYDLKDLEAISGVKDYILRHHLRLGRSIPEIIKLVSTRLRRIFFKTAWFTFKELSDKTAIPVEAIVSGCKEGLTVVQIYKKHQEKLLDQIKINS